MCTYFAGFAEAQGGADSREGDEEEAHGHRRLVHRNSNGQKA